MKKLFQKIGLFFKNLFGKEYELLRKYSGVAVKITQALKTVIESPVADVAAVLIPGDADDKLIAHARRILPQVAMQMALAHGFIQASATNADALAAIIENLRKLNPRGRVGFWMEFSAVLNQAFADGKLDLNEAALLAQMAYKELYGKK